MNPSTPAPQPAEASGTPAAQGGQPPSVESLQQELARLQDQYLRTLADVENTRKRLQREQEASIKYAAEAMVRQLLPILDSLSQALVAVDKPSDPQAVIKGVHLIYRQLLGLLEKTGVKRIPTVGRPFDPHLHEAVGHVEAQDGQADNAIVEEVQVGYTMHNQVIRPALVRVAKGRASPSATSEPAGGPHHG